jgi:4-hydroxy-3-methylbut-2-en-1-yl diphosphate reductase
MEIIKAKSTGYCSGVGNCVKKLREFKKKTNVFVYGPLTNNNKVVEMLDKEGVKTVETNPEVIVDGILAIRAHGVTDKEIEKLSENNEVLDLTCPKINKIHALSKSYEKKGYHIVFLGLKDHPEAKGIIGNLENYSFITSLENIPEIKEEKIVVLAQTTIVKANFEKLVNELKKTHPDLIVLDTICDETYNRQEEIKEMEVDAFIVVGHKKSNNTRHLYEIAKEIKPTYWINESSELNLDELKDKKVGLLSGSTVPNKTINKIMEELLPKVKKISDNRFLVTSDKGECYEVDLAMPFCECKGFYYNKRECKHIKLAREFSNQ